MGFIKFNNSYILDDIIIAIVPKIIKTVNTDIGLQTEYVIRLITTDENVNAEKLEERYLSELERDARMYDLAYHMDRAKR